MNTNEVQSIVSNPAAAANLLNGWLTVITIGLAAVLSGTVHAYQIVVQAGGLKNIWGKLLNGEQVSETPTIPPQKTEPIADAKSLDAGAVKN